MSGLLDPLDFEADVPIHEQIGARIRSAIARGAYAPDAQLPSVRALARGLLVNPNTIVRVYRDLEQAGIVTTRRGKGVFVAQQATRQCQRELLSEVERKLVEALELATEAGLSPKEIDALLSRLAKESSKRK